MRIDAMEPGEIWELGSIDTEGKSVAVYFEILEIVMSPSPTKPTAFAQGAKVRFENGVEKILFFLSLEFARKVFVVGDRVLPIQTVITSIEVNCPENILDHNIHITRKLTNGFYEIYVPGPGEGRRTDRYWGELITLPDFRDALQKKMEKRGEEILDHVRMVLDQATDSQIETFLKVINEKEPEV